MGFYSTTTRRRLLRDIGKAAALGPLIPLLNAAGPAAPAPKRLILFYTPHGTYLPAWTPTRGHGSATDFVLGASLQPLAAHQSKLNILSGVGMKGSFHQNGQGQLWSGSMIPTNADGSEPSHYPPNSTIDQVLAQAFGQLTPYPSLEFGVNAGGTYLGSRMIYKDGVPVEPQQDPRSIFNRLFTPTSAATLRDRASVLDAVCDQISALQSRIAAADRYKLAAHLSAVRSLEKRLQAQAQSCPGPTFPDDPTWETQGDSGMASGLATTIDLLVAALACDQTRVASLQFSFSSNDGHSYPWLGISAAHHALTHMSPSDTIDDQGKVVTDQARSVNGQLTAIHTWYAQMFAKLVAALDAVPEGAGTMLDNTLVVWGTELAHCYTHDCFPGIPFVTAGGLGGSVKTGRWLDYSAAPQEHNRLLVQIGRLMGLTGLNTFGATDFGSGGLSGF